MNLLYVTKTSILDEGGGGEKRAREVISGLADRNHDVTVVCGKTMTGFDQRMRFGDTEVRHVWCGPDFLLDKGRLGFLLPRYLFAFFSVPVVTYLLARKEFDVVIENMTPYPTLTLIVARLVSVPIVAVQHEFHGRESIEMYGPMTGRIQLVVQRLLRVFNYSVLVVPSAHVKKALEEYGTATDRIEVVSNGIEYEKHRASDVERQPSRLITVGRLCTRKGQRDLLEAFTKLHEEAPETKLDIVGAGPQRDALEAQARERGLQDVVRFYGFVGEQEKIRLMNQADLFVFASRQEGFGLAVLEAMAAGLPVIARQLPVYKEFFENGVHGKLISEPFYEQFTTETLDLLNNRARISKIRTRNKSTASEYGWSRTVDGMEGLLLDIATTDNDKRQTVN